MGSTYTPKPTPRTTLPGQAAVGGPSLSKGHRLRTSRLLLLGKRGVYASLLGAYASLLPREAGPERAGDQPKVTQ